MVKKMPPVKDDSDIVYDLGLEMGDFDKYRRDEHLIQDNHRGFVILTCPKVKRSYLHEIQVPNKRRLNCRGCGAEV